MESLSGGDASKPTYPGDQTDVFPYYDMNIIVGKNGQVGYDQVPDGQGGLTSDVHDNRGNDGAINVFNSKGEKLGNTISGSDAEKILKDQTKN